MDNTYKIIIAQASGTASEADLKDETLLREDLGMDSLRFINMIVALENAYGFEFDDEYLSYERLATVKDIADYVQSKAKKKG